MRAGFVNRTDLPNGLHISDIENSSQRNFSSQPKGQSRIIKLPSSSQIQVAITSSAFLSERGSNNVVTKDTSVNNTLRIRSSSSLSYSAITVTTGLTQPVATVIAELNIAFKNAKLPFLASLVGTGQVQLDTTSGDVDIDLDTIANGCTLSTALGFSDGITVTPLTVSALRAVVYPTVTTIDVSSATITGLSTFVSLTTVQKTTLVDAIADVIAPGFIETSLVILSFANGVFGKAASASFQPGGSRITASPGPAIACLTDDGVTPFSI